MIMQVVPEGVNKIDGAVSSIRLCVTWFKNYKGTRWSSFNMIITRLKILCVSKVCVKTTFD